MTKYLKNRHVRNPARFCSDGARTDHENGQGGSIH